MCLMCTTRIGSCRTQKVVFTETFFKRIVYERCILTDTRASTAHTMSSPSPKRARVEETKEVYAAHFIYMFTGSESGEAPWIATIYAPAKSDLGTKMQASIEEGKYENMAPVAWADIDEHGHNTDRLCKDIIKFVKHADLDGTKFFADGTLDDVCEVSSSKISEFSCIGYRTFVFTDNDVTEFNCEDDEESDDD